MAKRACLFLAILIAAQSLYADVSCLKGVGKDELTEFLGAWSPWEIDSHFSTMEYSWGVGKYIRNGTIVIDIGVMGEGVISLDIYGGQYAIEKIEGIGGRKYELTVLTGKPFTDWPEKGIIHLAVIDANKISIDDSDLGIFGFTDHEPGILYRLSGPALHE
jgi:hypothetical protein